MAILHKCDCCGKIYQEYFDDNNCNQIGFGIWDPVFDFEFNGYEIFDLCPDCMTSVQQHIKNLGEQKNG